MFTDFGKKPLLANWLPWQQGNVYFWFMRLKILLIPSFEKLPSFKVLACSVVEFWGIYWAGGGKHPPSAYRVKPLVRWVLSVVRAGVAKNPKIHCTRMKLLYQPAILVSCQKRIDSFWLKDSPCTKNKIVWIKKIVQHRILWKMS